MSYNPAVGVMNDDFKFRVIKDYYKMFPYEMSQSGKAFAQSLVNFASIKKLTFEKLLQSMIECATYNGLDEFLIISHGLHTDPNLGEEKALGLVMPIDDASGLKADADTLWYLLKCLKEGTSDDNYTNMFGTKKFKKGQVAAIVDKMRTLRTLKIRRVEFRACALGQDPELVATIGQCLGTRHCVAPKVHCSYHQLFPGLVSKDVEFDRQVKLRGKARVFENTSTGERVAMELYKDGRHWTITNSKDLGWFADKYIWPGTTYIGGNLSKPFYAAAMDTLGYTGKLFALPQEKEYGDMLVWKTNMEIAL